MSHRLSYAEKGKAVASANNQPRVSRIRAPESDNSELLHRHKLTLIGRLLNPSVQKAWSLIPFFIDHWKTSSSPLGADLGQGLFQFQFANEEDLQMVLSSRPFHFAGFMVIIQRWEPTLSKSFPSEIPFWIQVTGIPVHLWTPELIRSIGEDIGSVEELDISSTMARLRVRINGLQPLIKTTIVEFKDGEEIVATLVYERLKRHCKACHRLDHTDKDCPSVKLDEESRRHHPPQRRQLAKDQRMTDSRSRVHGRADLSPRHSKFGEAHRSGASHHHVSEGYSSLHKQKKNDSYKSRQYSVSELRPVYPPSRTKGISQDHGRKQDHRGSTSRYFSRSPQRRIRSPDLLESRDKSPQEKGYSSRYRHTGEVVESSQGRRSDRGHLPQKAMEVAMGELRDVMDQYASCVDPTESAARKERLRLAEEEGQFEETAEQMVRANLQVPLIVDPEQISPTAFGSQERIPVALRLGPPSLPPPPSKSKKRTTVKKRLGRPPSRPPGKSQGKKATLPSPRIAVAGRGTKRKLLRKLPSPRRRLNLDHIVENSSAIPGDSNTRPSHLADGTTPQGALSQGQGSRLSSSWSMDFQNPPKFLP